MAIAQMNWGRMRYQLDDHRMKEFADHQDEIYHLAENAPGFIWRIDSEQLEVELLELGYDERMSTTVSMWQTIGDLHKYTYGTAHGKYLDRTREWYEKVEGPQLVIWDVEDNERPSFKEAQHRLDYLKEHGPSDYAYGWK